jgi:drug/metabolite transporter (DMT)-like permease
MTFTTAANTIWLQNTAPAWVLVLGVLLLGESLNRRNLLLIGFGMLGVATILIAELTWGEYGGAPTDQSRFGVLLGIGSGLFYATVVLFLRGMRTEDSAWLVVVNMFVTAAAIAPYVAYLAINHNIYPSALQLAVLAGFGIFQLGLPYLLFARGLRLVSSQEAAGITLLEPVLVPIWVFAAWGESPAWWTLLGGGLILSGLVIRYGWPEPRNQ